MSSEAKRKLPYILKEWHAAMSEPCWNSADACVRQVGQLSLIRHEPRPWKWPREILRDHLVIPSIAKGDGDGAVEAFSRAPELLNDYTELFAERLYRQAPAHKRNSPKPDTKSAVDIIALALLVCEYDSSRSLNANCCRVAGQLGIDRLVVYRRAKSIVPRILSSSEADLAIAAFRAVVSWIEALPGPQVVRRHVRASSMVSNKNVLHADG